MDKFEREVRVDEQIENNLYLKRMREALPTEHPLKSVGESADLKGVHFITYEQLNELERIGVVEAEKEQEGV